MRAIRLHAAGDLEGMGLDEIQTPTPRAGEALVRVHAAAITRDELEWPEDRLPAIPSYEVSGEVVAVAPDVDAVAVGDLVYALTGFDRDGAAAEYIAVPAPLLAPKPITLDHIESAAVPMAAMSAWQGLVEHGRLEEGQRVLILGAAGGVGYLATQLACARGAHVIASTSAASTEVARALGAAEVMDIADVSLQEALEPVDLVFDTVGGEPLLHTPRIVRRGGTIVSIAEEPPEISSEAEVKSTYFVVEPNGEQLLDLTRLVDSGEMRPAVDSVFGLSEAREAFARSMARGKRGKVVLRVAEEAVDG